MSSLNKIQFETELYLGKVPMQWVLKFELFYPDIPHYANYTNKDKYREEVLLLTSL